LRRTLATHCAGPATPAGYGSREGEVHRGRGGRDGQA